MKTKFFLVAAALLASVTMMAAIGPQSVKVTFNGSDSEGWVIPEMTGSGQTTGTITSVEDGYVNITMGVQNAAENKYRADLQYNNSDDSFTFDRTKDVIWAIKLKADISGTGTNKKFELGFKDSGATKYTGHQGNQFTPGISCADGGKVYYFDLSSNSTITFASTEILTIEKIHFIFADAVIADEADAKYSVDWIATFQSVNDLTAFIDWTDEAQEADPSLPYYEALFRISYNGIYSYDNNYKKNGFKDTEFEGNYNANIFAIEYFLVDYHLEDIYTLTLHPSATNNAAISVWDFPHQETLLSSAETMYGYAQAITGLAPGSAEGTGTTPITSATCVNSTWTLNIPAYKLTPLATVGTKTLVGIFVTTRDLTTNSGAKFAPSANTEKAHPSFTRSGTNPIVNLTQSTAAATLSEAVSAASASDVLELRSDVTISGGRLDIAKSLTIQSATGAEKIICGVAANSIMVLANGEGDEHTVTLKNLVIDGNNVSRSKQTLEAAQNANICLDGVQFVNTAYSEVTGDVKNTGNKNVILQGVNSIPNGIYLNMNTRVKHDGATHTDPIKIYLAGDYAEDYAIVLTCDDASLYDAYDAANVTGWDLFVATSGANKELKGRKFGPLTHDLTVSSAGMATLVLGYDCPIPDGVKAYKLTNEGEVDIYAKEQTSIKKNEPVLIIADADTYTFTSAVGVRLDEQADPVSGCLRGTYSESPVAVPNNDGNGTYNYILTKVGDEVGFFHANSDGTNTVTKNHAYLFTTHNAMGGGSSAPMRLRFVTETATGIEDVVTAKKAEKLLIDGVIYIRKADHLYRIDGQLVK